MIIFYRNKNDYNGSNSKHENRIKKAHRYINNAKKILLEKAHKENK